MLAWLIAHPQFILAPLAAVAWFAFASWKANGYKLPAWGKSTSTEPDLKADLDSLLSILQRAKQRESVARVHLSQAIDALVREITA